MNSRTPNDRRCDWPDRLHIARRSAARETSAGRLGDSAIGTLAVGTVMRHSDRNDFEFGVREFITAFLSSFT